MGYQTDIQVGGPIRRAASSALVAVASTAPGRGVKWDATNAVLELCAGDDRVDFIVDEVHASTNEASVLPFSADRNFRVRLAASPGTLADGKLIKVDDSGNGLFALGGAASDVNVAICEDPAGGSGAAKARPIPAGTVTT